MNRQAKPFAEKCYSEEAGKIKNEMERIKPLRVEVISPDGFHIQRTPRSYKDAEAAEAAFEKWKQRYVAQGYYSSVQHGRIPLDDLHAYCLFNFV